MSVREQSLLWDIVSPVTRTHCGAWTVRIRLRFGLTPGARTVVVTVPTTSPWTVGPVQLLARSRWDSYRRLCSA